jgi:hypothetical protein
MLVRGTKLGAMERYKKGGSCQVLDGDFHNFGDAMPRLKIEILRAYNILTKRKGNVHWREC